MGYGEVLQLIFNVLGFGYLMFAAFNTHFETKKRIKEHIIHQALKEIKKANQEYCKRIKTQQIAELKQYIDQEVTKNTTHIVETVKKIIKENRKI